MWCARQDSPPPRADVAKSSGRGPARPIGTALAVAVVGLLLRGEAEEDRREADDEMRGPDVRRLVRKAEDPRRGREQCSCSDVVQVVHAHRKDAPDAELV